jgi:membrane protease YdiL (CAAX protease family)
MLLINVIAAIVALLSLIGWLWIAVKLARGAQVSVEHQPIVPWGLVDIYLIIALYLLLPALLVGSMSLLLQTSPAESNTAESIGIPEIDYAKMAFAGLGRLLVIGMASLYLFVRYQTKAAELGFDFGRSLVHLRTGLLASVLLIPPVMLLHVGLSKLVPYEHATLESLKSQMTTTMFLTVLFSAGLASPLVEEFLFRGIVQGFLERCSRLGLADIGEIIWGGRSNRDQQSLAESSEPAAKTVAKPLAISGDLHSPRSLWNIRQIWPIVASSVIFALMHLGQGLAPIPLFFLALGLGCLYWWTHSLIPGIIVHLILNVWSVIVLAVGASAST